MFICIIILCTKMNLLQTSVWSPHCSYQQYLFKFLVIAISLERECGVIH